jgi:hypothetical protein
MEGTNSIARMAIFFEDGGDVLHRHLGMINRFARADQDFQAKPCSKFDAMVLEVLA